MQHILKGDPKEVAKVLQENRIRIERGVIEFTPVQPDSALDADSIATLREALAASEKSCQEMTEGHVELAGVTRDVIAIVAENGITVPEELAGRLSKFGITVPKSRVPVSVNAETSESACANVPESIPEDSESVNNNKSVALEDPKEVNLDDAKDVEEEDSKAAQAPTEKKSRRYKKSE